MHLYRDSQQLLTRVGVLVSLEMMESLDMRSGETTTRLSENPVMLLHESLPLFTRFHIFQSPKTTSRPI